jgi:hypothetical protein
METTRTTLSQDAALVIALAGTAIPFAHSAEDEAERWLRAMRLQGEVGKLMQALGVGEAALMTGEASGPWAGAQSAQDHGDTPPLGERGLQRVAQVAEGLATEREAESIGTQHVLLAVLEVYGELFERALYVRGTSRAELLEHLDDPHPARSSAPRFRRDPR